jgi:hypothetical protein
MVASSDGKVEGRSAFKILMVYLQERDF